jgi:hypothetical protein
MLGLALEVVMGVVLEAILEVVVVVSDKKVFGAVFRFVIFLFSLGVLGTLPPALISKPDTLSVIAGFILIFVIGMIVYFTGREFVMYVRKGFK